MPQVTAQGKSFTCETGANLRKVLLEQDIDLYNGNGELPDAHLAVERGLLPSTTTASTVVDLRPYCFGLT
jgi:hypothetical protein